jgi:pimeloyl-ACP methyl ester carboxylesterase
VALVEIDTHALYCESHGQGDPPLLLVMGLGGSCQGWLPLQVPEFSRSRRTLIYDHRGVGQSGDPGDAYGTA